MICFFGRDSGDATTLNKRNISREDFWLFCLKKANGFVDGWILDVFEKAF